MLIQTLGISVRKFEESCGIANGTIGSIKEQGPTTQALSKIADTYPELDLNWLIRGKGTMFLTKEDQPTPSVSIGSIQTVNIGNWDKLVELLKGRI